MVMMMMMMMVVVVVVLRLLPWLHGLLLLAVVESKYWKAVWWKGWEGEEMAFIRPNEVSWAFPWRSLMNANHGLTIPMRNQCFRVTSCG